MHSESSTDYHRSNVPFLIFLVKLFIVNVLSKIISFSLQALAYTLCVYFLAGLSFKGDVAPFFEYLLLLVLVAYFGSSIFFFLSTISPITEVGNALAGTSSHHTTGYYLC